MGGWRGMAVALLLLVLAGCAQTPVAPARVQAPVASFPSGPRVAAGTSIVPVATTASSPASAPGWDLTPVQPSLRLLAEPPYVNLADPSPVRLVVNSTGLDASKVTITIRNRTATIVGHGPVFEWRPTTAGSYNATAWVNLTQAAHATMPPSQSVPAPGPGSSPTSSPATGPTSGPTAAPTASPSAAPTASPSAAPTASPTTNQTANGDPNVLRSSQVLVVDFDDDAWIDCGTANLAGVSACPTYRFRVEPDARRLTVLLHCANTPSDSGQGTFKLRSPTQLVYQASGCTLDMALDATKLNDAGWWTIEYAPLTAVKETIELHTFVDYTPPNITEWKHA